jgi:tripeptidyl-peptidase II
MSCRRTAVAVLLATLASGCGGAASRRPATTPAPAPRAPASPDATATEGGEPERVPAAPLAFVEGLMPLGATGVDRFQRAHPTYDGRGVIIGILDSGVDPGIDGLIVASTGAPKILDLRDFSGEGRIALTPVTRSGDSVTVGGRTLLGAGRIGRLATGAAWYAGTFREILLGKAPAADVNGNGTNTDVFPVVVVKAMDGWVVFLDSNLNGSFEDEQPLHDYRQGRETIALGTKPLTLAANFAEDRGTPVLDLYFDTSGHGTHVAGIAAGHNLYGIAGFDGVAPGAQIIGLKIANDARDGITVHGSMWHAMDYAARFAAARNLPLVLNMSFGVGNEHEGRAAIDSIVNVFLRSHPDVVFAISAGNDGPGLSTIGFPASADLALTVGALFSGVFARAPDPRLPPAPDALAWFSARGADTDKPDIVTPGVAYSTVPRWNMGDEVKGGTSMAAPHAAGLAARLISAMAQENHPVSAADVMQALRASAAPVRGTGTLDGGAGVPQLETAYRWLRVDHQGSTYMVRTDDGGSAAFRRAGLAGPADTTQVFHVAHAGGLRAAQFTLTTDAPWVQAPATVTAGALGTDITVTYRAADLATAGVHTATVTARNPSDTSAGPLFSLINTVVVPYDLAAHPLADERRAIDAAQVRRYFLRANAPGSTLGVTVTIPDSLNERALVKLYEPTGQPFRDLGDADVSVGEGASGTVRLEVRGEDFVPGVYELDVIAPPLAGVTASVQAAVSPVSLVSAGAPRALEATNAGNASAVLQASAALTGAERRFDVDGRGLPAESLVVRVPAWASGAEVDVAMPPEQWDAFTDFGVTVYDSSGQQVATSPMNYAVGRLHIPMRKAMIGQTWTVELFPAYARPVTGVAPVWRATVRVRFLLAAPRRLGWSSDLTVVGGARAKLDLPAAPSGLTMPAGFLPLLEVTAGPPPGPEAPGNPVSAVRREPISP